MYEFNPTISYCEVDKCKAVIKLKKCLQEIKETIQNRLNLVCNDCMLKQCKNCDAKQIIKKISEVENDSICFNK